MRLLDSTVFSIYLDPTVRSSVSRAGARVTKIIDDVSARKEIIVIPTLVLSEVLAVSEPNAINEILKRLDQVACFRFADFDRRAAVENAMIEKESKRQRKKAASLLGSRQKVKVDRMIVAIAKTEGVDLIYSDDGDVQTLGSMFGVEVKKLSDVEPQMEQTDLDLSPDE